MNMKMGSVAVAIMWISAIQPNGAEAQFVSCYMNGENAPFADAATVVEQLRITGGLCCQTSNDLCTVVLTSGNAAATVCGPVNYCPSCADVGDFLDSVLAQCNQLNQVEGAWFADDTFQEIITLTSAS